MDLIIIAAGNGTRMGNISYPKCLHPVAGEINLHRTLDKAQGPFENVHVVIRNGAEESFAATLKEYPYIKLVPIDSGLGEGHAVLEALRQIHCSSAIIVWGDAYIKYGEIFAELKRAYNRTAASCVVPVVDEFQPYVTLVTNGDMEIQYADLSKFGEHHHRGLHDQSMFAINVPTIKNALLEMHRSLWKGGRYISESKELNFLHCLHYMANTGYPAKAYITEYPTGSFNTQEEAKAISSK